MRAKIQIHKKKFFFCNFTTFFLIWAQKFKFRFLKQISICLLFYARKFKFTKKIKDAFFHFLSQDESLKMAHKRMENSQSLMHIFRQQLGKLRWRYIWNGLWTSRDFQVLCRYQDSTSSSSNTGIFGYFGHFWAF